MRATAALVALLPVGACGDHDAAPDATPAMFGSPVAATGLGADRCRPDACAGFVPPAYSAAFIQALVDDWTIEVPFADLTSDPYAEPAPATPPDDAVCAVEPVDPAGTQPRRYRLAEFASLDAAMAADAHPTNYGACGVCSTLSNLAVYMREIDLGQLVRQCGVDHSDLDGDIACLEAIGFDHPCAQIWAYNTGHTRDVCLATCLVNFDAPYNNPDGTLNDCLQCDEDMGGAWFKAIAGRTRRNSGLANAICRPCGEVQPLVHDYGSGG